MSFGSLADIGVTLLNTITVGSRLEGGLRNDDADIVERSTMAEWDGSSVWGASLVGWSISIFVTNGDGTSRAPPVCCRCTVLLPIVVLYPYSIVFTESLPCVVPS